MIKHKRFTSFLIIVLLVTLLCGCNKDYTTGTPFDKNNTQPTASVAAEDKQNSSKEKTDSNTNDGKTNKDTTENNTDISEQKSDSKASSDGNSESSATSDPVSPTDTTSDSSDTHKADVDNTDTAEKITPTATPIITDDIDDIGTSSPTDSPATATPEPINRDSFDRAEYWERTFFVWLPMFTSGTFSGQDSAGTFDYATFSNVSMEETKTYIDALKNAGFTQIGIEKYSDDAVSFGASNDQSWEVRISFTGSTLVLGSGFVDKDQEEDDKTDTLFSTTLLQYLPRFSEGEYVTSETRQDSTMYASIVFTDVSKSDVLSYIEKVKESGYVYAPDEGNTDNLLWYIALNEEGFECCIEFGGSDLKISCSYEDED